MQERIDILNQEYHELDKEFKISRDRLDDVNRFLNSNILYKSKKLNKKR